MVSTLDSESNDPSSSLGRTSSALYFISLTKGCFPLQSYRTKTYRISLLSEYYNGTNDFDTQKKMLWYVTVRLKWKTVLTISSGRVFSITLYFIWWSLTCFLCSRRIPTTMPACLCPTAVLPKIYYMICIICFLYQFSQSDSTLSFTYRLIG